MRDLETAKEQFNLLNEFPNAKRINNGVYRVNPCPVCGHKDHFTLYSPNTSSNKNSYWTYASYSKCCNGGSPVDYLMEIKGLDKESAIAFLTGSDKEEKSNYKKGNKSMNGNNANNKINREPEVQENKKIYDFTELAAELNKNIVDDTTNYFKRRGLDKVINKYCLGYSKNGFNSAFKDYKEFNFKYDEPYKYFIPLFDSKGIVRSFIIRAEEGTTIKVKNLKGVDMILFNQRYLENKIEEKFIYICEGWADSLSFEEFNRKSISLNSTSNDKKLIELIKKNKKNLEDKIFILCLDNDESGKATYNKLKSNLDELNISNFKFEIPEGHKDVNEFLVANKEEFESAINRTENNIKSELNKSFKFSNGMDILEDVFSLIEKNYLEGVDKISTGFHALDEKIGGGLYNGLYVVGAGSSIGKTTFIQQIADTIAKEGKKVLFYSLEMGKIEMVSKSLVREMYSQNKNINFSTREFMNGELSENDFSLISSSTCKSGKFLKNIEYVEGSFTTTIQDIVKSSKSFKALYGETPVIVVDYLQAIAPNPRLTDKQNVDLNIAELKRLSRDLNTPVIAISSINRQNYLSYIDFTAFKESGAIEYGADVVIGLQLNAIHKIMEKPDSKLNEKREEYNSAKRKDIRDIELVILKNRYGVSSATHNYKYYPKFNYFEEEFEGTEVSKEESKDIQNQFENGIV